MLSVGHPCGQILERSEEPRRFKHWLTSLKLAMENESSLRLPLTTDWESMNREFLQQAPVPLGNTEYVLRII